MAQQSPEIRTLSQAIGRIRLKIYKMQFQLFVIRLQHAFFRLECLFLMLMLGDITLKNLYTGFCKKKPPSRTTAEPCSTMKVERGERELEWDQEKGVNPATSRVDGPVVTAKREKGASVKALFSICIGIVSGVSNQVTAQKLRQVGHDFPFMSRELDVTIRRYERGENMENQKYVVGTRSDEKLFNSWYAECKTKIIPYANVVTRTKYSDVSIDCITLQNSYDIIISDNLKQLCRKQN